MTFYFLYDKKTKQKNKQKTKQKPKQLNIYTSNPNQYYLQTIIKSAGTLKNNISNSHSYLVYVSAMILYFLWFWWSSLPNNFTIQFKLNKHEKINMKFSS